MLVINLCSTIVSMGAVIFTTVVHITVELFQAVLEPSDSINSPYVNDKA